VIAAIGLPGVLQCLCSILLRGHENAALLQMQYRHCQAAGHAPDLTIDRGLRALLDKAHLEDGDKHDDFDTIDG
jgi:hypothetical protein